MAKQELTKAQRRRYYLHRMLRKKVKGVALNALAKSIKVPPHQEETLSENKYFTELKSRFQYGCQHTMF